MASPDGEQSSSHMCMQSTCARQRAKLPHVHVREQSGRISMTLRCLGPAVLSPFAGLSPLQKACLQRLLSFVSGICLCHLGLAAFP
eukprot:1137056-Pelagomonas_calceolata.AAC.5